jgi:nitrite reductase/ring-hydroxylating ferredoxin subunit
MTADDPRWTAVGPASDWPEEGGRLCRLGARRIGVYRHQGQWYALKDICPHAGVSLVQGAIDAAGSVLCVGHGWRFDLRTGDIVKGPGGFSVPTYPVRVVDGVVEVGL